MREMDDVNVDLSPSTTPLQAAAASASTSLFPTFIPVPGAISNFDGMTGPNITVATAGPLNGLAITKTSVANTLTLGLSGVGVLAGVKTNVAGAAPGVNDDAAHGYARFSQWIDTTGPDLYGLLDATTGAAVWKKLSP